MKITDWKTTVPAAIVLIAGMLQALGILTFPETTQNAIIFLTLFVIGLLAGEIVDWKTTIPAILSAVVVILAFLNVRFDPEFVGYIGTVLIFVVGLFSGGVGELLTTTPATITLAIGAIIGILRYAGVDVPPQVAQAINAIMLGIIGLFSTSKKVTQ